MPCAIGLIGMPGAPWQNAQPLWKCAAPSVTRSALSSGGASMPSACVFTELRIAKVRSHSMMAQCPRLAATL